MNYQRKRVYLDRTQKLITKVCWDQCATDPKCIDLCYENFLNTITTVNSTLQQLGYNKFSRIAFKAYPDDRIDHLYLYTKMFRYQSELSYGVKSEASI